MDLPLWQSMTSYLPEISLSPGKRVFPERPKAVLVISGHWDTSEPAVSVINGPNDVIYDFYGFPEPMYEVGIFSFLHLLDRVLFFLERIHEWREITYAL